MQTNRNAMKTQLTTLACAGLAAAVGLSPTPAAAQHPRAQSEKELSRNVPADSIRACSLITRADVTKATGSNPYVDPEPAGEGGWICNLGIGELKVYSGPNAWEAWEATLKRFKKDQAPQTPVSGFGERAYFIYPKPDNAYQGNVAFLVAKSGNHTLALSLDAPEGKSADSMRPALESLMKLLLARLR
jgi:hypothetical protein